jgi:hypothetical protein
LKNRLNIGLFNFFPSQVLPPGEWDPAIRIEPPSSVPSQQKRVQAQKMLFLDSAAHSQRAGKGGGEKGGPDKNGTSFPN